MSRQLRRRVQDQVLGLVLANSHKILIHRTENIGQENIEVISESSWPNQLDLSKQEFLEHFQKKLPTFFFNSDFY